LRVEANRLAIASIISETSTKYANLQSEINELLENERNAINKNPFLDDDKKQELVNTLEYKSYLPDATTHLKKIKEHLVKKNNQKEAEQSRDTELFIFLRNILDKDKCQHNK
jgi:hypothetical protein